MNRIIFLFIAGVIALYLYIFTGKNSNESSYITLKKDSLILAFGDSITYGYGLPVEHSYPYQLQKKTGVKVINAGLSGEESTQGLKRLRTLLKKKPDLVILCHGGNDILRKRSHVQLKNNILAMVESIHASGAKVLLVGVPNFNVFSGFNSLELYSEIANETGVVFEEDVLSLVESDNSLKIDTIHPNRAGYEIMADAFMKRLVIK